jgi:hypothetical protein
MWNGRIWLGSPGSNARTFQNPDFPAPIAPRERLGNRKKIPGGPLKGPLSRKIFRRFLGSDTAAVPLLKNPDTTCQEGLSSAPAEMSSGWTPLEPRAGESLGRTSWANRGSGET